MQRCNKKDFAYQTWVIIHITKGVFLKGILPKFYSLNF